MFRKLHFFLLIGLLSFSFSLTNTFADENGAPIDIEDIIADGNFVFPTAEGPAYIQGDDEFERVPENIFGSNDFEKMRDLPTDSQDYQLSRKVGMIAIANRAGDSVLACTGFLVGPDLFMTNRRCLHDEQGILPLGTATAIYMDYYQDPDVDQTGGGIKARVSDVVWMDTTKDYALLRLDRPIGNTYGWLELDTTTRTNSNQSVKLIAHNGGRSKEIVRRNSEIVSVQGAPEHIIAYLADTERGSHGAPVFLSEGTGVIAIHHASYVHTETREPLFNAGILMSYIVPEIQQWLPDDTTAALAFNPPTVADQTFTIGREVSLTLPVATGGTPDTRGTRPYTYSCTALPAGLYFDPIGNGPGFIGGTPTTLGTTRVTYTATDAARTSVSLNFTIEVVAGGTPTITFNPPTVADQTFTIGQEVSLQLPAPTGGTRPYSYTLTPQPPAGLYFDPVGDAYGFIGGTPTTAMPQTRFTYTATDTTDASASLNFTIKVVEEGTDDDPLDVNNDGQVTVVDLAVVAILYGTQVPTGGTLRADVNGDGRVNVPDLIAVAAGIDAAGNAGVLAVSDLQDVLEAIEAYINALEAAAEAPARAGVVYQNVATAFKDAKHIVTDDARLLKWMPLLNELLLILAEMRHIPDTTALLPNYPNPFNPETWIPYHLAQATDVSVTIHDVRGSMVRELPLGYQPTGVYENRGRAAYWDGRNEVGEPVASGLYFYTLTAGDFTATRKLLIVK